MNTKSQITVEILRLKRLLKIANEVNHPSHIIKFYNDLINKKMAELELIKPVEKYSWKRISGYISQITQFIVALLTFKRSKCNPGSCAAKEAHYI
jgi:hypothetical protein